MPLYHFHLRNVGERIHDDVGRVADAAGLSAIALREARGIVSADALTGWIDLDQRIEVEDADGRLVLTLPLAEAVRIILPR